MHLKARQQKTREPEGVREDGRESMRGGEGGKKEAKRAFQEDVERQSKHRPEASAALRASSSSWKGVGWGKAFLCHSCCTQVVDAAI